MNRERYEIEPRPAAFGGGWNLHLFGKDWETGEETEIGCQVFPPDDEQEQTDAFLEAIEVGKLWIRERTVKIDSIIQTAEPWIPLAQTVGHALCKDFMWMGRAGTVEIYKHIDTRRYLRIDAVTGVLYDGQGSPVTRETALAYTFS